MKTFQIIIISLSFFSLTAFSANSEKIVNTPEIQVIDLSVPVLQGKNKGKIRI